MKQQLEAMIMICIEQGLASQIIPKNVINEFKNLHHIDQRTLTKLYFYTNIGKYI